MINSAFTARSQRYFWKQRTTVLGLVLYVGLCLYVFSDYFWTVVPAVSSLGGDSIKNLFTYLYGAAYGGGSLNFKGMNYPFGEHLSFADAQPMLTVPVGWLQKYAHFSLPQLLQIMYAAIALSFVVGMVYTQRILQYFSVPAVGAILFSALIMVMSPSTFRYVGHYPLAYASLLPMLFYWSVKYYETNKNIFLGKIFIVFIVYSFLHLYFIGMGLLWAGAYFVGSWLWRRNLPGNPLWHGLRYLIPVLGTFALTKLFFEITDGAIDRPEMPYAGGYEPGGGLNMLTSIFSPVWAWLQKVGLPIHMRASAGEFCYLGFVPVTMLVTFGIITATGFWKKISAGQHRFGGQWIFIAGLTLLFSVTIKYFWEAAPFEALFRPLRQFRSPERFSWIAYYVLSVLAAIVLYRICRYWWLQGRKVAAGGLGFLVLALWAIEAKGAVTFFSTSNENAVSYNAYLFSKENSWKAYLNQKGYQPQQFSSILGLPFVHVGSEKLWLNEVESYVTTPSFKASLELHLPIVDVYMSRTSWKQTFEAARLVGGPYASQSLLRRFPANQPVLLIHYIEYSLTPDETALLNPEVTDVIGEIDGCRIYAFWPRKWLQWQTGELQKVAAVAAGMPAGTDTLLANSLPWYQNHFEAAAGGKAFAGRGGLLPIKGEDSLLGNLPFSPALAHPVMYEFSAWSWFNNTGFRSNYYKIKCFDRSYKELLTIDVLGKYSTDNSPDMWFRVSKYFEVPAGTSYIQMVVYNPDRKSYLGMDEVLLRPVEGMVISKGPNGKIIVNNHLLLK